MHKLRPVFVSIVAGVMAAGCAFVSSDADNARADDARPAPTKLANAVFAGGCFWCVESDFDTIDGVYETISGYTGGTLDNPTYKQVSHTETGHYEAVKVSYDPTQVSYEALVEFFFRSVDPTDPDGQFCDKGSSYRTAVFVNGEDERSIAEAEIAEIETSGVLPAPVVTPVIDAATFWPAEDYHQDYYKKSSIKYKYYRNACGRDDRVEELWGAAVAH